MEALDSAGDREYQGFVEQSRAVPANWRRGRLTVGTETNIWQMPTAVHTELEALVKAGLTPLEAIRAETLDAERIVGIEQEVGSIDVGQ